MAQQTMGSSNTAMSPMRATNLCETGMQSRNPCATTAASTLLVIVVGMSAMILLVLVSIALLCRSHLAYRDRMQRTQAANGADGETAGEGATGNGIVNSSTDMSADQGNFLLVLFPGEKYPVTCAHVSPLHPSAMEPSAAIAINVDAQTDGDGNLNANALQERP